MTALKLPAAVPVRQMNLLLDNGRLERVNTAERTKIVSALAHLLLQAAGLSVPELDDDER